MAATHYGEELRAIGQALEAKGIMAFELKRLANWYLIQNTLVDSRSLRSKLRQWLRGASSNESLTLSWEDVAKLSEAGRSRRTKSGRLTEFRNLSNIMRTLGAYLDSKQGELVELQKRAISITLIYRDREGTHHQEDRTIASFYRDFVELCAKRSIPNQTNRGQ
jgi:hypothetical protein